ncbi:MULTISPECIES: hypothetical protein [Mesorhizobium]|uniref:hypothetical protein n=1 Tax=Mesorhizobium TaxID=68287 RepID=UPI0004CF8492|nr:MULTISPECIES: hypothetical protein [Mesorhizobium]WJI40282.1 hypothetical protein NL534_08590 [Mesorhizobium opportunistum]
MGYKPMMNDKEHHGLRMAAEIANAQRRIKRTEIALKRTEELVAENIERSSRMRRLVEAADRLVVRGG